jgi:hypothetical protein
MFFKIIAFCIFTLSTFAFSSANKAWTKEIYDAISLGDSILENPNDPHVQELLQEFLNLKSLSELPLITISEEQQRDYERLTNPEASKSYTEYLQYVAKIAAQYFNHGDVILPEYTVVIRKCTIYINNIIGKFNAAHKIFIKELEDTRLEPEEKLILALNYIHKNNKINLFYQFLLLKKLSVTLETLSLPENLDKLGYKQTLDFLLTSCIIDYPAAHYNKFNLNLIIKGTQLKPSHFCGGKRISDNTLSIYYAEEKLTSSTNSLLFSTEEQLLFSKILTPMTSKFRRLTSSTDSITDSYITITDVINLPFYILHAHDKTLSHKEFMSPVGCHFIDISHELPDPRNPIQFTIEDHVKHDFNHLSLYFMKIFSKGLLDILALDQANKPELVEAYLNENALEQGLTWDALKKFLPLNPNILPLSSDAFDVFLSRFFFAHQERTTHCVEKNNKKFYPFNFSPKLRTDIIGFFSLLFSTPKLFNLFEAPLEKIDISNIVDKFKIFLETEFLNHSSGNSHSL